MRSRLYLVFQRSLLTAVPLLLTLGAARAQYCTTSLYDVGCDDGDYIEAFSTTGGSTNISGLTGTCDNSLTGYTYFSGQSHTATAGSTIGFTLTNNPGYEEEYKIWVDWNEDSDFTDAGEEVYSATLMDGQSVTSSFSIPAGTTTGTKRLRIRCVFQPISAVTSCSFEDYGEVEDYNVVVMSSTPCSGTPAGGTASSTVAAACPGTPFTLSLSGATLATGITIQWQSAPGTTTGFTNIPGATGPVYTIPSQTMATSYRAVVTCGTSSANSTTVSVPMSTLCYCSPLNGTSFISGDSYNELTNVSIPGTTLNSTTSSTSYPDGYLLLTAPPASNTATLNIGTAYTLDATFFGPSSVTSIGLWIDYNQNGTFDAAEFIPMTISSSTTSASATFTPPATALAGLTGMRLAVSRTVGIVAGGACSDLVDGEVEDYMTTIVGSSGPTCSAPTGLAASSVTSSGATLAWSPVTGATGYRYVLDQLAATPTTSGTLTTATGYAASGLAAATTYYFHLRTQCGTDTSNWVVTSFTTAASTGCTQPASLTVTNTSATGVRLTWTAMAGATGYEHANTTSSAPPTSGTLATGTTVSYSGLTASTMYYAHVRTKCGTAFSPWRTTQYTKSATAITAAGGQDEFVLEALPNPTNDVLTVRVENRVSNHAASLTLTDVAGRVLRKTALTGKETVLHLAGLPAGIYLLRYTDDGRSAVIRVQKL